jgi:hypothetical protein
MPRTHAPLTVEKWTAQHGASQWLVVTEEGGLIAAFARESDARAFVALPALRDAVVAITPDLEAPSIRWQEGFYLRIPEVKARALLAALAQADGPAPKE